MNKTNMKVPKAAKAKSVQKESDKKEKVFNRFQYLKKLSIVETLGKGTFGKVYYACQNEKKSTCRVVKLIQFNRKYTVAMFETEVYTQDKFHPYAPKVFGSETKIIGKKSYGALLMQKVPQTLDKYISAGLTKENEKKLIDELATMLIWLKDHKYTHGDLALFNIGIRGKKLMLIDFDRSTVDPKLHSWNVDLFRVLLELSGDLSTGTNPNLEASQLKNLFKGLKQELKRRIPGLRLPTNSTLDSKWREEYNKYMQRQGREGV